MGNVGGGITGPHGTPVLGPSRASGAGPALPGLRLMGKGWMLAAPQLFLQGLQPQVSAYLGPGEGGGWSLYLLWETLGQFHVPPVQEAGAVVVRAQT